MLMVDASCLEPESGDQRGLNDGGLDLRLWSALGLLRACVSHRGFQMRTHGTVTSPHNLRLLSSQVRESYYRYLVRDMYNRS